ncbi:MAG: 2-hydroxyacyl-CoA dehydratase family protein [Dehalococcoidia bacterium]|nr:2-hydroxyacyl-CoA dehydratase family protein [Dehalococcoidia bacterium]
MANVPNEPKGSKPKTTATKSTRTANLAYSKYLKKMYTRAAESAARGNPVAWVMAGAMADEILVAMDIGRVYPENFAGVCAAKKGAQPFLEAAESDGFSNVICGYARTGIGYGRMKRQLGAIPPGTPDGGMPDPAMLVGRTTSCDIGYKWFQAQKRYEDAPLHVIDVVMPPLASNLEEVLPSYIEFQTEELRAFIAFVEKVTGRKMDYDRLNKVVDIAHESIWHYYETHKLRRAIPCPMPTQDHLACFAPGFFMLGEPETLEFYKDLHAEVQQRVDEKVGVIPNEEFRLLWAGGLPPWHNLGIFNYFESLGAVFVAETCYNIWDPYPPGTRGDVVEWIARSSIHHRTEYLTPPRDPRVSAGGLKAGTFLSGRQVSVQWLLDKINDYKVDGLVMHGTMSCRACTIGQLYFKDTLKEYIDLPTLFIESDIIDERNFSETNMKSQIDSFVESLANARKRKQESQAREVGKSGQTSKA